MPSPDAEGRKGSSSSAFWYICAAEYNHFLLWFWIYIHIATTGMQAYIFRSLSENEASTILKINLRGAKAGINEQEGEGRTLPTRLSPCQHCWPSLTLPDPTAAESFIFYTRMRLQISATDKCGACCSISISDSWKLGSWQMFPKTFKMCLHISGTL